MKKSYLNTAINVALTSIVLSSLILQSQANASTTDNAANSAVTISDNSNSKSIGTNKSDTNNSDTKESDTYLYPGMGIGAATGTLIAGPVGFIVGGAIGALIGVNQDAETEQTENSDSPLASDDSNVIDNSMADNSTSGKNMEVDKVASHTNHTTEESLTTEPVQIAQIGSLDPAIINESDIPQEELMNILVSDLSLDVYFRTGSTDIEKFYPARLAAIANLVNSMDKLELHLDGYTDRRGNKEQNIALANTRIERVREQLIDAGVSPERIVSKAFGEAKMKSAAGNLEAYTFDRRVVIRFERISTAGSSMDTALIDAEITGETIINETTSDETNSDQSLTEISDTDQNNAEITETQPAGFVTVDAAADLKTAQTPVHKEANPTVADAANRF
jgi:outer membrane protein OmpA-like peptidoglycan-associated protein